MKFQKNFSTFEPLEPRRMRSATMVGSQLSITGTSKADGISVSIDRTDHSKLDVSVRHVLSQFAIAGITRINIQGLGGNDLIDIDEKNGPVTIAAVIHGGAGDDTIRGGSGKDHIFGDDGNDDLSGGNNRDVVDGDAGDDS